MFENIGRALGTTACVRDGPATADDSSLGCAASATGSAGAGELAWGVGGFNRHAISSRN